MIFPYLCVCIRPTPSSLPTPWDDWDLGPKFFTALSQWTHDHPENALDPVFERICVDIDSSKELTQFVPDSPFPARGLVGALVHLMKLGAVCKFRLIVDLPLISRFIDYIGSHERCSGVRKRGCALGRSGEVGV